MLLFTLKTISGTKAVNTCNKTISSSVLNLLEDSQDIGTMNPGKTICKSVNFTFLHVEAFISLALLSLTVCLILPYTPEMSRNL